MRRSPLGFVLLFVVALVVTAIAYLPLSMVIGLSGAPIQADRISGTVWNGTIENGYVEGYPIGRVQVSGKMLPLLRGRLSADVSVDGPLVRGTADISAGHHIIALHDTAMDINLSGIPITDAFGAPMSGNVRAETRFLSFDPANGRCLEGEVSILTDTLEKSAPRYGGQGFPLQGTGACQDGAFVLPLAGEGLEGKALANLRLAREGYTTELVLEPRDARLGPALVNFGFQRRGNQYSLIRRGEVTQ